MILFSMLFLKKRNLEETLPLALDPEIETEVEIEVEEETGREVEVETEIETTDPGGTKETGVMVKIVAEKLEIPHRGRPKVRKTNFRKVFPVTLEPGPKLPLIPVKLKRQGMKSVQMINFNS